MPYGGWICCWFSVLPFFLLPQRTSWVKFQFNQNSWLAWKPAKAGVVSSLNNVSILFYYLSFKFIECLGRSSFFKKACFAAYHDCDLFPGGLQLSLHGGVWLFFERNPVEQCRQKWCSTGEPYVCCFTLPEVSPLPQDCQWKLEFVSVKPSWKVSYS